MRGIRSRRSPRLGARRPARPTLTRTGPTLSGLARAARDRRGNVSIEMAFLVTFLLVLVMGAYDFGRLAMEQSTVTQAARAGAQFAVLDQANATNADGIRQAARAEAEDPNLDVDPDWFCRCPGGPKTTDCTTNCTDGNFPPMYVEVTVEDSLAMLFDYPGLPETKTYTLRATSTMRVR
ncbi:MAG: TadE/TadG family type IV pilus assembly protein [Kiloniellales bacterium]|nr:TadE/TadG family type IV pilus assembly protein [Kiloniellales bacterium]